MTIKISVDLPEGEYDRLHAIKYHVNGGDSGTHAGIMRTALRLLFDAYDAAHEGEGQVLGLSSGKGQRTRKVLVEKSNYTGIAVTRR